MIIAAIGMFFRYLSMMLKKRAGHYWPAHIVVLIIVVLISSHCFADMPGQLIRR